MRRYFEQFGDILEAVIITDKTTGRSKGYGFESQNCPLSRVYLSCNPFNLVMADEDIRKGLNNIYDRAIASSLSKIFQKDTNQDHEYFLKNKRETGQESDVERF
ncbi:hypothetical protein Syun_020915 [Stephania yunnanensis]|uniref:RRM domain-containing protein n=1 Tax=Stephania yunnanensis TaxID=152371 RepID=A0AAP0IEU0_9MAGN